MIKIIRVMAYGGDVSVGAVVVVMVVRGDVSAGSGEG